MTKHVRVCLARSSGSLIHIYCLEVIDSRIHTVIYEVDAEEWVEASTTETWIIENS
jgi:hypothetical protein